jgi:uncharacterized membrane protein
MVAMPARIQASSEVDQSLVEWIKTARAQGHTPEAIYLELLQNGHTLASIREHWQLADSRADGVRGRTVRVVLAAAALLIAAGVFSFVAANWERMPREARLGFIVAVMLAANVWGWSLRARTRFRATGEALLAIGTLVYGAGIFLVAQMFHVRANWPDGFMLWLIGAVAMAVALRSLPLFALAAPIGLVALVGHPLTLFGAFGQHGTLLTPPALPLVTAVVAFVGGWALRRATRTGA